MRPLRLQVIGLGYGKRCHGCNKLGGAVSVQLWQEDHILRNLQLCKACLGEGVATEVTVPPDRDDNPLKAKEAKKRIKQSRQLESKLAEDVGGKAQPGSGSTRLSGFKGDVRKFGSWRIEHKYTESVKTWILKLADLAKIVTMAMDANEYPALVIEFTKAHASFAIIPLALFLEMVNADDTYRAPARRRRR